MRRNSDSGNENENEEVDCNEESETERNSNVSETLENISVNADPPATQVDDTFDPVQTL